LVDIANVNGLESIAVSNWDNGNGKSQLVRRGIHVVGDGKRVVKSGVNEFERPGVGIALLIGPLDGNLSSRRRGRRNFKDKCRGQTGDKSKGAEFAEHFGS
jgi:hypothetical protein